MESSYPKVEIVEAKSKEEESTLLLTFFTVEEIISGLVLESVMTLTYPLTLERVHLTNLATRLIKLPTFPPDSILESN